MKTTLVTIAIAAVFSMVCADIAIAQQGGVGGVGGGTTNNQGVNQVQTTTTGGTQQEQLQSSAGQITGEERFLRENRTAGAVVGADNAGAGLLGGGGQDATAGQTNQFGNQGRGGNNPFGNQFNNAFNQFNQQFNQQNNRRQQFRVPIVLGFTPKYRPSPAAVTGQIQARLSKIPRVREMGAFSVAMDGRTAILSGAVATEGDRTLLARLMLLEPGVLEVRNELAVTELPPPPIPQ